MTTTSETCMVLKYNVWLSTKDMLNTVSSSPFLPLLSLTKVLGRAMSLEMYEISSVRLATILEIRIGLMTK